MKATLVLVVYACLCYSIQCAPLENVPPTCSSTIYCQGQLLHDVQMARLFEDSKTFVDKKLLHPPSEILDSYEQLKQHYGQSSPPVDVLRTFVEDNFEDGNELEVYDLPDWVQLPTILGKVKDPDYRAWADSLNGVWKNLSRKMIDDVKTSPNMYSLLYVPNGFVIPGGRFRELYYWDTYWIIKGIIECDMIQTAKGVIENLLSLVMSLGHVPNGSRVYYTERSQPPMLTLMVETYLQATADFRFVKDNIHILDKEMNYWIENRKVDVEFQGKTHSMFRYNAVSSGPRPESYREDTLTVSAEQTEQEKSVMFTAIKSAAESGWDFSTRWFIANRTNKGNLSSIATPYIIPVDLNALLERNLRLLSLWHGRLGNIEQMKKYSSIASNLRHSINTVLWSEEHGVWFDYDIENQKRREYLYLSNFVPLWTKSHNFSSKNISDKILNYMKVNNLEKYIGGTPTSLELSGEQWDFPNAWAPLQAFVIQGLDRIGTKEASETAFRYADKWIHTNYMGYKNFGKMFEKYDALLIGQTGSGGEYNAQTGFGWTNGLVFEFLAKWGKQLKSYEDPKE